MRCYICNSIVKRVWQNGGIRLLCTNKQCKAPQDDAEAYTAKKYKQTIQSKK